MATKKKPAGRDPTTIEAEQEHLLPTTSISYGSQRTEDYTANKEFHLRLPSRMANYLDAEISTRWADLVLIVCFFMAGLIDAGAYNAYQCFTSMQVCFMTNSGATCSLLTCYVRLATLSSWPLESPTYRFPNLASRGPDRYARQ